VPAAIECARANAAFNGVADRVEVRLGDCLEPVRGEAFDLICTSPPQMPTPPARERDDPAAAADNGGADGWELLDPRRVAGTPERYADFVRGLTTLGTWSLESQPAPLPADPPQLRLSIRISE